MITYFKPDSKLVAAIRAAILKRKLSSSSHLRRAVVAARSVA